MDPTKYQQILDTTHHLYKKLANSGPPWDLDVSKQKDCWQLNPLWKHVQFKCIPDTVGATSSQLDTSQHA